MTKSSATVRRADLIGRHEIRKPSFMRQFAIDAFDALPNSHAMTAFMEFDVSVPLQRIAEARERGVRVSLFAHVARSVAQALAEHPNLNVVRHARRIAFFDDVDLSVPVEVETEDGKSPLMLVVRRAQDQTAAQIYDQIEASRTSHSSTGAMGAEDRKARRMMRFARLLPRPIRLALIRRMMRNAMVVKRLTGTTLITSVGKFAKTPGFVTTFATGPRGTTFAVGSLVDKAVVRDGQIVVRPVLALTALFNHDVVDGGPAARFAERLQALVESGEGIASPALLQTSDSR